MASCQTTSISRKNMKILLIAGRLAARQHPYRRQPKVHPANQAGSQVLCVVI